MGKSFIPAERMIETPIRDDICYEGPTGLIKLRGYLCKCPYCGFVCEIAFPQRLAPSAYGMGIGTVTVTGGGRRAVNRICPHAEYPDEDMVFYKKSSTKRWYAWIFTSNIRLAKSIRFHSYFLGLEREIDR